jgi:hypothetical protein
MRKYATEPGDRIMMYTGLRTKKACKFGEAPCIKIEPIVIYPWKHEILKADHQGAYFWLNVFEMDELAEHDGFADLMLFFEFFKQYERDMLDDFEIIHWDPLRVEVMPGVKMFSAGRMWAVRGTAAPYKMLEQEDTFLREYSNTVKKLQTIKNWETRRMR